LPISGARRMNCVVCKHPAIPRSPYCPRPLLATKAESRRTAPEDPLLALRDAEGPGAGDRERAVGAGLATRRFGDATLARGW
jgi:hypothetical protein